MSFYLSAKCAFGYSDNKIIVIPLSTPQQTVYIQGGQRVDIRFNHVNLDGEVKVFGQHRDDTGDLLLVAKPRQVAG